LTVGKYIKKIVKWILKTNHIVGDEGDKITGIKSLMMKILLSVEFQLEDRHPRKIYCQNPL